MPPTATAKQGPSETVKFPVVEYIINRMGFAVNLPNISIPSIRIVNASICI